MSENITNLVNAIRSGDATSIEQSFGLAMAEKLGTKIEDMRQSIASNMFKQPQEDAVEDTVEENPTV